MKKALITGITGQDGAYLSKLLLGKGYEVYGAFRGGGTTALISTLDDSKLKFLGIQNEVKYVPLELSDPVNIYRTIAMIQPDEIYNLGAQTSARLGFEQPMLTTDINGIAVLRILEAIRSINPKIRFFQASSNDMFGKVQESPQNEKTSFCPGSTPGIAKLYGHWITVNYRESYDIFACSGILFDHDSPLRNGQSVPGLISKSVARIKMGLQDKLTLGNIEISRDLGYAEEYVEAMWLMLQQDKPDDYVIATGETHPVREFIQTAFDAAGINIKWTGMGQDEQGIDVRTGKPLVTLELRFSGVNPTAAAALVRSHSSKQVPSQGDYTKAKKTLGWEPKVRFKELFRMMVENDLKQVKNS
jgi:GDPmannose 4,6-dehydratase